MDELDLVQKLQELERTIAAWNAISSIRDFTRNNDSHHSRSVPPFTHASDHPKCYSGLSNDSEATALRPKGTCPRARISSTRSHTSSTAVLPPTPGRHENRMNRNMAENEDNARMNFSGSWRIANGLAMAEIGKLQSFVVSNSTQNDLTETPQDSVGFANSFTTFDDSPLFLYASPNLHLSTLCPQNHSPNTTGSAAPTLTPRPRWFGEVIWQWTSKETISYRGKRDPTSRVSGSASGSAISASGSLCSLLLLEAAEDFSKEMDEEKHLDLANLGRVTLTSSDTMGLIAHSDSPARTLPGSEEHWD
ncbi:hypothetical protein BDZ91DRAFT_781175 [Kalaharituber pfeilii]|nr:hypothetical protein BDZ91DRAFT_781175 [Kalaharituber pfeilii]